MAFKKWLLKVNKLMPPKLIGLIIALLFFAGFVVIYSFRIQIGESDFYQDVAVYILVSWLAILIIYYSWVIGFYNINYGWTDTDWDNWEKRREYDPKAFDDAPTKNPHANDTLGLPNGTVRGTIAVSLMVLAVAMMIASLTFSDTYDPPSQFVDNFKFFKDAFLLMIAFYFGNKGLELIKARQQGGDTSKETASQAGAPQSKAPANDPPLPKTENNADHAPVPGPVPPVKETTATPEGTQKDFKDPNSVG